MRYTSEIDIVETFDVTDLLIVKAWFSHSNVA